MSLGLWPEAVPFDPNSGTASHDLRRHFDEGGMPPALLLVCARDLRGAEWPARAAIGLARALVTGSRQVSLLDLDFERPGLHALLDVANSEGVADAILFGASLERVTVEPAGEMFGFVPAGAVAPDPAGLMADPTWGRIVAESGAANGLLLGYAPLGVAGLDALAQRIPAVILLAPETEVAATAAMLPETIRVEGVIRPAAPVEAPVEEPVEEPAEEPAEAPVEEREPEPAAPATGTESEPVDAAPDPAAEAPVPAREAARRALQADIEARQRAAAQAESGPPVAEPEPAPAPPRESAAVPAAAAPAWKRALRWVVPIVLLSGVGWLGGRLLAGSGDDTGADTGAEGRAQVQTAGSLLGYSVAIEAYDDLSAATLRADSLALAAPDLIFFVAPVDIDGSVFFRVMAGPMTDSATASATMERLVRQGLKIASSEFDVRSTPLAFLVGDYDLRGDAEARMTELEAQDVPTYMIEVPYTQGPSRFHVYAGAYSGPSEAEVMRRRLRDAGIADTLVLRVGRSQP